MNSNRTSVGGVGKPAVNYEDIQALMAEGNAEEAIDRLELLLRAEPDHAPAHNDLGVLYFKAGDKERSQQHYKLAALLAPDNIVFQKNLADFIFFETGNADEAIRLYLLALEKDPRDIDTLTNLGFICIAVNQPTEAELFFNRVLELEPANERVLAALAGLRGEAGPGADHPDDMPSADDDSIRMLESVLSANPDSAVAHNDLGTLYYRKGDKLRALFHHERASGLSPENVTFMKNLADFCFFELGQTDYAIEMYLKALQQNDKDIDTLMNLGHICTMVRRPEEAKLFFGRILALEPWNDSARESLGALGTLQ